jgi:hypothetical protein
MAGIYSQYFWYLGAERGANPFSFIARPDLNNSAGPMMVHHLLFDK